MKWRRTYQCTADFRPFQHWQIEAESAEEARLILAQMLGINYEETEAKI
jgi:hypothetical protein